MKSNEKIDEQVNTKMPHKLVRAIDNFRRNQTKIVSRSEVVRVAVEKYLEAEMQT